MPIHKPATRDLLRLTLTPGLGPVLIARALEVFGSPAAVLASNEAGLRRIRGIGDDRARSIVHAFAETERTADRELAGAEQLGVQLLPIHDPDYPPLLRQISDAPPILYIRGRIDHAGEDRYPIAIVGSRSCTAYGIEQSERFAMALAQAGLTVVSGGARGIDTAAHRAVLRVKGRTIAVLGCGLSHCYPPDNHDLFDTVADGRGAIVSELPLSTPPSAENFPARNRVISGLALGVLVVEAGRRSGALITARLAAEDHGREVFAIPARIDSTSSAGSLDLIKSGGAAMVTNADDILAALESPARHLHGGTHEARFAPGQGELAFKGAPEGTQTAPRDATLTAEQSQILAALDEPKSFDDLARIVQREVGAIRADVTILEIRRRVERRGSLLARRS